MSIEDAKKELFKRVEQKMEHEIAAFMKEKEEEAEEKGIHGKESTPFLLARVKELTGGDSLDSNIQLVYNNARLASRIAKAYVK